MSKDIHLLEQRQNKNDTISSISKSILKLPPFFTARIGDWKSAASSKLICLWTKWSRSYIVLALVYCGTQRDLLVDHMYPIHSTNLEWFHLLFLFLSHYPSNQPQLFPLCIIEKKANFIIVMAGIGIKDATGKQIWIVKPTRQKWKYHGQPGKETLERKCTNNYVKKKYNWNSICDKANRIAEKNIQFSQPLLYLCGKNIMFALQLFILLNFLSNYIFRHNNSERSKHVWGWVLSSIW